MNDIAENLISINDRISRYERHYSRDAQSVRLLAVSKTKPITAIMDAHNAGQRDFGENYLDEALEKINQTRAFDCNWHFIGHIQSNKSRAVAENFTWVHTLDREKIAKRLSAQRPEYLPPINCCIQVNIDAESSKSGVSAEELPSLLENISGLPQLRIRGLMVIPAARKTIESQREVFRRTRALFEELSLQYPHFDTLSMGMSADMEAAIAEGSTIVRIGTAVFGSR